MFKAGVEGAHAPGGMKFCFFFSEKISLLLFIDMFLEIGTRMIYRYQIWSFSNLGGRMMLHIGAVCDSLPLHYIQANDKVFFPQAECRILQHPCFFD